jgi:hypothetical protein
LAAYKLLRKVAVHRVVVVEVTEVTVGLRVARDEVNTVSDVGTWNGNEG